MATGCGTQREATIGETSETFAATVKAVPSGEWADTGLPYGGLSEDREAWTLSYRTSSVTIPATRPEWTEASGAEPGRDSVPILELATAGATTNAGIFQLRPPDGDSEVWELTSAGKWQQIGTGVSRIALADIHGPLVAWVAGGGDEATNNQATKVVAYDTKQDRLVAEVPGSLFPGNHLRVIAVDGGSVILQASSYSDGTDPNSWTKSFVWRPDGAGSPSTLTGEVSDYDEDTSTWVAYDSRADASMLFGPSAEQVRSLDGFGYAQFNGNASQVALFSYGQARILSTATLKPIAVDIPLNKENAFDVGRLAWTSDDRLLVEGLLPDQEPSAYLCNVQMGTCQDLGPTSFGFASGENSSRGQVLYHNLEDEGGE